MGAFAFPYNENGVVGHASNMDKQNVITRIASGVTATAATKIGFAQPVARGTAPKTAVMWDGTNGAIIGLTLASGQIDPEVGYQNGDNVPVINEGQIWGYASGACTAGSTPEYVPATGGWQDSTDPEGELHAAGLVFEETVASGGVVRIQVQTRIA